MFSFPGSLRQPSVLPNIIEDALQITKALGERHLWVDSVISSICVNASSRLSGVRPNSRKRKQESFSIRDVTLILSLDPVLGVNVDRRPGRATGYLGETGHRGLDFAREVSRFEITRFHSRAGLLGMRRGILV